MTDSYKIFPALTISLLPITLVEAKSLRSEQQPNVIIIMTDDQGYGEMSVHGNPVFKTPNLDSLHDCSIRFTDFHVSSMSTPTRGQLMTGLDAVRNGAVNVSSGRTLLRRGIPTMADYFSEAGYATAIFGKWHLGDNYPFRPEERGFDEALWFPSSHIGSVPDFWLNDYFDDVYIRNGKRVQYKGFCTDVFFSEAKKWIANQQDSPFMLYLPLNAPHYPFHAPEEDILEMEIAVSQAKIGGMKKQRQHDLVRYLAMIRNVDKNIGELMHFLADHNLTDNTIILFLTDNGSTFGPEYYNAGMRGGKTQLYEGGHRVPLFIKWGNKLGNPRDIDGLSQVQDILPTLLDLCKINYHATDFDGISLASVLQGKEEIDDDRTLFINFSRMPSTFDYPSPYASSIMKKNGSAVLWKRWRYLNEKELYNLETDPAQQNNVIDHYPEIANQLQKQLDEWWQTVEQVANKPERVIIGDKHENPSVLTSCEWMDVFVDQQIQIRKGVRRNSYWLLEVAETGIYEFELRRWPKESGLKFGETLNSPKIIPVNAVKIYISGEDQNYNFMSNVTAEDECAKFKCQLNKGNIALHTWLLDSHQIALSGAYYVYVTKL